MFVCSFRMEKPKGAAGGGRRRQRWRLWQQQQQKGLAAAAAAYGSADTLHPGGSRAVHMSRACELQCLCAPFGSGLGSKLFFSPLTGVKRLLNRCLHRNTQYCTSRVTRHTSHITCNWRELPSLTRLPLLCEIDALALQHLQSQRVSRGKVKWRAAAAGTHVQQRLAALEDLHVGSFGFHNRLVVSGTRGTGELGGGETEQKGWFV
jgi:hypothetical protein